MNGWNAPSARNEAAGSTLALEWRDDVEELLAVARLLVVGELAAAAIGHPRLRELVEPRRVDRADVLRAQDTGDLQLANLVVDADLLPALDHQIAVGQH